ncbi:hypothetical protein J6590_046223 [Homalodisca vitripennis]|nr:hypothetical protein J6590_046223 [Homalodisca vitripennis]
MVGQAGCLQGQDHSAVTHPSSSHARRCLICSLRSDALKDSVIKMDTDEVEVVIATAAYAALRKQKVKVNEKDVLSTQSISGARIGGRVPHSFSKVEGWPVLFYEILSDGITQIQIFARPASKLEEKPLNGESVFLTKNDWPSP